MTNSQSKRVSQSDPIWAVGHFKPSQTKTGTTSESTLYYVLAQKKLKMLGWEGCGEQINELQFLRSKYLRSILLEGKCEDGKGCFQDLKVQSPRIDPLDHGYACCTISADWENTVLGDGVALDALIVLTYRMAGHPFFLQHSKAMWMWWSCCSAREQLWMQFIRWQFLSCCPVGTVVVHFIWLSTYIVDNLLVQQWENM